MRLPPLKLRRGDRAELEARLRSNTIEARAAKRARIILLAADGASNRAIGQLVDLHYNQVGTWRSRYEQFGLPGLEDEERPGRPAVYDHDDVLLLVKLVTEDPPDGLSRWTMDALSEAMADHGVPISASQAWRICKALDLKPWQVESWMTSHDPDFWEKASDVCGLYLRPPHNAVVWSVDEKSGMQAKSRINPTKPAIPGTPSRREFEYRRNGTAVLFAALNVHEGDVAGWVTDSTRSDNFVEFLGDLVKLTPEHLDLHCIADNLSAHKTAKVQAFLADNPRVHIHHTPTHASWLNQVWVYRLSADRRARMKPQARAGKPSLTQVQGTEPSGKGRLMELFFSILECRLLRRGEFDSVDDLADKVIAFINDYNRKARPFRWTYDGKPLRVA